METDRSDGELDFHSPLSPGEGLFNQLQSGAARAGEGDGSVHVTAQAVTMTWDNPFVATERGRFCTCEVTGLQSQYAGNNDLVISHDDADQSYHGEVIFILEKMLVGPDGERQYIVVNSQDTADGTLCYGGSTSPAVIEGFLEKKQPPPGFRWQRRWFELSLSATLRYFEQLDDDDLQLKGVLLLKDVTSIEEVAGSDTDFVLEVSLVWHHGMRSALRVLLLLAFLFGSRVLCCWPETRLLTTIYSIVNCCHWAPPPPRKIRRRSGA